MSKRNKKRLVKSYLKYRTNKRKQDVLGFFRNLIPEIIYRTTKLEGEPITRRMVSSLKK